MEEIIQISKINDFIFCPYSIYLHGVYESFHESIYHEDPQRKGKIVHETIESGTYSSAKRYLQGLSVYSSKYHLVGKIDIYDTKEKALIERKYKIKKIFDGHLYQLYAQYFGLKELGYDVKKLYIHSLSDNKRYRVDLPAGYRFQMFETVLDLMKTYSTENSMHPINPKKCAMCIYRQLCHKALC